MGVVERLDHLPGANDWLISIQDDMLVPFGAMHPDLEDKASEVRRMREAGIKGFKLHPMVNSYYPDDPLMFPFYEEMGDDMVVEIHSGRWAHTQPGDTIWAEPARIMNVVKQFPKLKLIALHLGGFYMLDEAERELIGRENVLIDTTWPPALKELGSETLAGSSAATALKRFASAPISRWQTCRRTRSSSSRCPCPMRRRSRCWARTPGS